MSTRNLHPVPPAPGSYADEFLKHLDTLEADIKATGLNMTEVCRRAGVARCTPDRWRSVIPKTVRIITDMEAVVAAAKQTPTTND